MKTIKIFTFCGVLNKVAIAIKFSKDRVPVIVFMNNKMNISGSTR